jgi:hypothetical protein
MALAVIGAGWGRTGTLSLKLALERLGFGPCYHMIEVFGRPADIPVWERATDGEPVDWDALFAGYRSAVDWPACTFWRELAAHYPEAKVVLTERDAAGWYRSAMDTILPAVAGTPPAGNPVAAAQMGMAARLVIEKELGGRIDDREEVLRRFALHGAAVRRGLPAERLLVYRCEQGWEPLSRFLGVPVPDEPFPRANTTEEFRQHAAALMGEPGRGPG